MLRIAETWQRLGMAPSVIRNLRARRSRFRCTLRPVIDHVVVWNRRDCCTERLNDAEVVVSDWPFEGASGGHFEKKLGSMVGVMKRSMKVGTTGRYVMVRIKDQKKRILSLTELQVFGSGPVKPSTKDPRKPKQSQQIAKSTGASGTAKTEEKKREPDKGLNLAKGKPAGRARPTAIWSRAGRWMAIPTAPGSGS